MTEKNVTLEGGFGLKFKKVPQGLRDVYGQPPFSVLDARRWQDRKRKWLALGIQSEIGRGDNLLKFSERAQIKNKIYGVAIKGEEIACDIKSKKNYGAFIQGEIARDIDYYRNKIKKGLGQRLQTNIGEKYGRKLTTGTSIFDPVLCELMYNWFCPIDGNILDPFCGGSVRGVIAGFLKHSYIGFDLRTEQVESNEFQLKQINQGNCISSPPQWICDDSLNMKQHIKKGQKFDFLFTCPPYGNLEVYSDDPRDLSNKVYDEFLKCYDKVVFEACQHLKNNRFACFVVANFRDKSTGFYHDFIGDTVYSFKEAGLNLYNEMVLVNAIGSLPIRVGKQFKKYRKVGKTHQNILVFYKGEDQKKIKKINFDKHSILETNQELTEEQ